MAPRFESNIPERDGFRGAASTAPAWLDADRGHPDRGPAALAAEQLRARQRARRTTRTTAPTTAASPASCAARRRLLDGAWTTGLRVVVGRGPPPLHQPAGSSSAAPDQETPTTAAGAPRRLGQYAAAARRRPPHRWQPRLRHDPCAGGGPQRHAGRPPTSALTNGLTAQQHTTAGWAALQYRVAERLDLSGGLRPRRRHRRQGATTWKAGAVLALPEIASRLRPRAAAASRAVAVPALRHRRFDGLPSSSGNPDLKPERCRAGRSAATPTSLFGSPACDRELDLLPEPRARPDHQPRRADGVDSLVNIDRAHIHGAELGLTLRPDAALRDDGRLDHHRGLRRRDRQAAAAPAGERRQRDRALVPVPRLVIAPTVLFTGRSPEGAFASYANDGTAYPYARSNPAGTVVNLTATWAAIDQVEAVPRGAQPRQQPVGAGERLRHARPQRAGGDALRAVAPRRTRSAAHRRRVPARAGARRLDHSAIRARLSSCAQHRARPRPGQSLRSA